MIISQGRGFVYTATPRTASTAMRSVLGKWGDEHFDTWHPHHVPLWEIDGYVDLDKYWVFCFIRNPWELMVSRFLYFRKSGYNLPGFDISERAQKSFGDFLGWRGGLDLVWEYRESDLKPVRNFREFVTKDGKVLANRIFRYEDLNPSLKEIEYWLHINMNLPHLNKSGMGDDWRDYYKDWSIEAVAERYRWTIERFSYTF